MNSDKVTIENLLEVVSPEILKPYELMNSEALSERQLYDINSEYVTALENEKRYDRIGTIVALATFMVTIITSVLLVVIFSKYPQTGMRPWLHVILTAMLGMTAAIGFWRTSVKCGNRCKKMARILETFRSDLEVLKWPAGILCKGSFTEARLKDMFVFHAENILDAKMKLNKVRLEPELRLSEITRLANQATQYEETYSRTASVLLRKFGMQFENREIFPEAQRRLNRSLSKSS